MDMTPAQALQILDQMVARAPATRADHDLAVSAMQVLVTLVGDASSGDDIRETRGV